MGYLLVHILLFGRQRQEMEIKDTIATARKVQKADREKLRRDRLNEQFLELGNTLGKIMAFSSIVCLVSYS